MNKINIAWVFIVLSFVFLIIAYFLIANDFRYFALVYMLSGFCVGFGLGVINK